MQSNPQANIKKDFENGKRHTVLTILAEHNTTEGRRVISRLRTQGMKIADNWKTDEHTGKRYKVYFLKSE